MQLRLFDSDGTKINEETNSITIHFDSLKWEEKAKEILKEYEASNIFSSLDTLEEMVEKKSDYAYDENSFRL